MPMGGEETSLDVLESDQVWVLKLVLDGMDPNDFCLLYTSPSPRD